MRLWSFATSSFGSVVTIVQEGIGMPPPLELPLRIMGHSARKITGENARYGGVEGVPEDAPRWVEKMWR